MTYRVTNRGTHKEYVLKYIPAALANAVILFSSPVIASQAALTGNAGNPHKKFVA